LFDTLLGSQNHESAEAATVPDPSRPAGKLVSGKFCNTRNYRDVAPKIDADLGDKGYSLGAHSGGAFAGAPNPYIYLENLPRTSPENSGRLRLS